MKSYYEILEVGSDASQEEIKKSYRRLALKYHPDTNAADIESEKKFREIQTAYEILSDPVKKEYYDKISRIGLQKTDTRPANPNKKYYRTIAAIIFVLLCFFVSYLIKKRQSDAVNKIQTSVVDSSKGFSVPLRTGDVPKCYKFTPEYFFKSENKIELSVGNVSDAVVKLIDSTTHHCIRYVYLKFGSSYVLNDIPNGIYYTRIFYGTDWREFKENTGCKQKFAQNPIYTKSEYAFLFSGEHREKPVKVSLNPNLSMVNNNVYKENVISEGEWEK